MTHAESFEPFDPLLTDALAAVRDLSRQRDALAQRVADGPDDLVCPECGSVLEWMIWSGTKGSAHCQRGKFVSYRIPGPVCEWQGGAVERVGDSVRLVRGVR